MSCQLDSPVKKGSPDMISLDSVSLHWVQLILNDLIICLEPLSTFRSPSILCASSEYGSSVQAPMLQRLCRSKGARRATSAQNNTSTLILRHIFIRLLLIQVNSFSPTLQCSILRPAHVARAACDFLRLRSIGAGTLGSMIGWKEANRVKFLVLQKDVSQLLDNIS